MSFIAGGPYGTVSAGACATRGNRYAKVTLDLVERAAAKGRAQLDLWNRAHVAVAHAVPPVHDYLRRGPKIFLKQIKK